MSPVSTSNDPTIGYTSKHGAGLGFDPIAARNPDRPKFRLDDYEANEPREAEPPRSESRQSKSDRKTETPQSQRRPDNTNAKDAITDASGVAEAKTEHAPARIETQEIATHTNTSKSAEKPTEAVSADTFAQDSENADSGVTDQSLEGSEVSAPQDATAPAEAATIASNVMQAEPSKVLPTAAPSESQKTGAGPATTSGDAKLAALEKLTQTGQSAATTAATPRSVSGDDTTAFKLPVPWPPQTQSETTQGSNQAKQSSVASQAVPTPQQASGNPQMGAPGQTNQAAAVAEQASQKATGETVPKIEIVSQEPAKPTVATDTALIANSRTASAEGSAKPAILPTPSETIAAATALNSRPAQSNALGRSNVERSNAVTASNENNGTKATANQGQQNSAIVSQTVQTNPAATAFTAATQAQSAVTTPEQLVSVRQQSSSTQRGQVDQSATTSNTSRPADLPAQGTGSGFTDSLRMASADRTAATQDRQTLPTPATEQVKVKLVKAALGGLDRIKIQLNPSELGKVEVRLEIGSDGAIRGTVIADKPETMDLLQRDAKQLERALQDAGLKTGGDGLDFQMRGGDTNERQQQAGSGNGALSKDGGDLEGSEEQLTTDITGSEQDGIGDDGSLNLVA
ncbi:flagellar hook-length control protein FliK [Nisaea sp.]|uniref:flagellar hook-length control protein FliK n=1 Tax=Nisaea sp. TaxID=2024842 RepID=UPI0032967CC5